MVEIKADESISGFAQAAYMRDAQRNPEPEPEPETAPEPQVNPEPAPTVEDVPRSEPVEEQGEAQVASPYLQQSESDPMIISEMLHVEEHRRHVNRLVYGDQAIADAFRRRAEGTLNYKLETSPYQPLPHVMSLMALTGENPKVIGYYLAAKTSPRAMAALDNRLGEARMNNLRSSFALHEKSQEPKGLLGTVAGDIGTFFGEGEFVLAPLAAMAGIGENVRSMQIGFAEGVANRIGSELNVQARITPNTDEELAWLDERMERRWIAGGGENKVFADRTLGKSEVMDMPADIYDEWMTMFRPNEERIKDLSLEGLGETKEELMSRIDSGTGQFMALAGEYIGTYVATPGFSKGVTMLGRAVNGLTKGAITDAVVYNEGDMNVSAWIAHSGIPGGEVLEFLATDPDDSEIMNFAKVLAEGGFIGTGFEALGFGLVAIKNASKGNHTKALESVAKSVDAEAKVSAKNDEKFVESINELRAKADEQHVQIADGAEKTGKMDTKEIFQFDRDKIPDFVDEDELVLDAATAVVRVGTASGVSSKQMEVIFGAEWLGDAADVPNGKLGKMYGVDAREMYDVIATRFAKTMEKLQNEPVSMNMFKGMAFKLLDQLDEDMIDSALYGKVRNMDPSEWSTNDAVNIFAAASLQDMYVERANQIIADLASNADQMDNKLFQEKMKRINVLQEQVARLQVGIAKAGTKGSHAMHALKRVKKAETELARREADIKWQASRGLISDKRMVQLLGSAFKNATDKRSRAKVFNEISTKPTTLEKILHISNANLLFNTGTQGLMLIGNFVRATIRNPMANLIEAAVVNPIEGVLGRADWAEASSQSFKRFWHSYGAIAQSLPDAMTAYSKFWRSGKSQFGENSMFDDKGYYTNKTLKEVRQSKAEGSLDHGMKAAEHVYRFMGAVDEGFKEIVISSEMATHARAGTYGDDFMKLAQKRKLTNADFEAYLMKEGEEAALSMRSTDGRIMDSYARDVALDTMFQSDAAAGSLNKGIKSFLMGRTSNAMILRLFFMRFVTTPLNVMEERMATALSPFLLVAGDNKVTDKVFKLTAGKFHRDLKATLDDGSPDMRVRSRTRAILAANSIFTSMGLMSAIGLLKGDGDEGLIDVDPKSRTYGQIRIRYPNGKKRYLNTLDMEVPFLNAFVFARMAAEHVKHAQDIEQATEYLDTVGAITAMYLNQTLEKSSLKNMTDSLAVILDDDFKGGGQLIASNLSTAVPFNFWLLQLADLTGGGEFQGKPVNFYERLGKSIGPLKLMGFGAINQERDALGRLQPSHSRGFNPFISREFAVDALSDELADIQEQTGTDFLSPTFERDGMPYHKMKAQDGQSVYDFMQESISQGDVKINGMTLEQAANAMIEGDYYQTEHSKWRALLAERHVNSKSQPILKVGGASVKDPRVKLWRGLLSQYRDAALRYALTSVGPEIRKELEEVYQTTGWTDAEKRFVADQF